MSVSDAQGGSPPANKRIQIDREAGTIRLDDPETGGSLVLDRPGLRSLVAVLVEAMRHLPPLPNEAPLMALHRPVIDIHRDDAGSRILTIQPADLPAIEVKLLRDDAEELAWALGLGRLPA